MSDFCHFDATGSSRMVDVGNKPVARRLARASGLVRMAPETLALIHERRAAKGDVIEVARLAGIMAAKRTHELIPLCHQLPIEVVAIDFLPDRKRATLEIEAWAVSSSREGRRIGSVPTDVGTVSVRPVVGISMMEVPRRRWRRKQRGDCHCRQDHS